MHTNADERTVPRENRGAWARFLLLFRSIRLPWLLIAVDFGLGLLAAQFVLWLAPVSAQLYEGDLTSNSLLPAFVALSGGALIVGFGRSLAQVLSTEKIAQRLRSVVWSRLLRTPMAVINREQTPDLVSRVTNDPAQTANALLVTTGSVSPIWGLVGGAVGMAQANGALSMLFLGLVPVALLATWVAGRTEFIAQKLIVRALGSATGYFGERLGQFAALKFAGVEAAEIREGDVAIGRMFRAGVISELFVAVQVLLGAVIQMASLLIVFVGGAAAVRDGSMAQEDLVLFYSLAGGAVLPFLFELVSSYTVLKGVQGYTFEIGRVLTFPTEDGAKSVAPIPPRAGALTVENVSFDYGDVEVLHDVSFCAPAGRVTAIVGSNGSGKSTLLALLQRTYEPTSGSIRAGETRISDLSLDDWRRQVGVVPQDPSLVTGTLWENLAFSDHSLPPARVDKAVRVADLTSVVSAHADRYDQQVGEGGARLSGGQRQRVAIARAIASDPHYLLLDEAGSALDPHTDAGVDAGVRADSSERTVVMVSHKPHTISAVDHVVVLDRGRVVGAGTYSEVLRDCPLFQRLVDAERAAATDDTPRTTNP